MKTKIRNAKNSSEHRFGVGTSTRPLFRLSVFLLALGLSLGGMATEAKVTIMTQNVDSGTDLGLALALGVPAGMDLTLAEVQASNIPQRADLLAGRIAEQNPQLVALEEGSARLLCPVQPFRTHRLFFSHGARPTSISEITAPAPAVDSPPYGSDHAGVIAAFEL